MSYIIVGDSCTDTNDELEQTLELHKVPLTLQIEDYHVVDDENFNQIEFIEKMHASLECPKSACPSPQEYLDVYEKSDEVYVVTLSSELSGSYNSARLAQRDYEKMYPNKKITVVDSRSASGGQTLIALKVKELKEKGLSFEEVKKRVIKFRNEMQTKFVLESVENLKKNGRLLKLTAALCEALNIKPVLYSQNDGEIHKLTQARGMKKALAKMIDAVSQDAKDTKHKILSIAHCNNRERAEYVKRLVFEHGLVFKDVIILETGGVSTLYANQGGIIISY